MRHAGLLVFAALSLIKAQDTRKVTEPRFPAPCAMLTARLEAPAGALAEASEGSARHGPHPGGDRPCEPGKAVALRPDGERRIFLAGPLQLKAGVTLLVEAGAAIFASRNPRDYDLAPGSCGVVGERGAGRGCKPLVTVDHAPGSGIMGDGAIEAAAARHSSARRSLGGTWRKQAKVMDLSQTRPG